MQTEDIVNSYYSFFDGGKQILQVSGDYDLGLIDAAYVLRLHSRLICKELIFITHSSVG